MFPLRLPRCRVASDLGCAVSRRVAVAIELEGMQPQSRPPYRSLWQWDGGAGGVHYPHYPQKGQFLVGSFPSALAPSFEAPRTPPPGTTIATYNPMTLRVSFFDTLMTCACSHCGTAIVRKGSWFKTASRVGCAECQKETPLGYEMKLRLFEKHATLLKHAAPEDAAPVAKPTPLHKPELMRAG